MLKNFGSVQKYSDHSASLYFWPTLLEENTAQLCKDTNADVNNATGKLPLHISTSSSDRKVCVHQHKTRR